MALEEAIHFANAAGALATQTIGAQPSIPVRDAILALVGR
jgi:sugar/nucleoside kinase (ribokinase family)